MEMAALKKGVYVLLFLFLLFTILYLARPFLVPLTFAILFAMLLLPVYEKMEAKGVNKVLAGIVSVLILLLFFAGILSLLAWQVSDMAKDAHQIEQNVAEKINQLRNYLTHSLHISFQQQEDLLKKQQASISGKLIGNLSLLAGSLGSIIANTVLMLVYVFLMLYFRIHFKNFVLKLVRPEQQQKVIHTMQECRTVAQKYLTGLALMIVCLWVMYGIGFSLIGVKNALFFAILCGLLEIVPFVGNLTGTIITVLMSLAQGGSLTLVLGVIGTYALVQFLQTYILEPLVVGGGVNLNPFFTIVGIIAGELLWGVPGMILAIPGLGVAKIICDNVEVLKPYGYLIGQEKPQKGHPIVRKLKAKMMR